MSKERSKTVAVEPDEILAAGAKRPAAIEPAKIIAGEIVTKDLVDPDLSGSDVASSELESPDFSDSELVESELVAGELVVADLGSDEDDPDRSGDYPDTLSPGSSSSRSPHSLVRYDPLESYLAEIRTIPQLTRDEELIIAKDYRRTGDPKLAYKLIVSNLRLVVMVAREYQRNVQNVLDLVQEGNVGLLEAVKQFDPFRGTRFPSYAMYWIRAYMLRYLINNLRLVKVGTTQAQRKLVFNLQKERDKLEAEGFVPEAKLLAERLNVKESEVLEMEQRLALPDLSVDAPLRTVGGEEGNDLHGILPSAATSVEDQVANEEFSESVRDAVARFRLLADEKEQKILDRRLFTDEPITLQEIADEFGLSRERIRQIEHRLRERLREYLRGELQLGAGGEVVIDD